MKNAILAVSLSLAFAMMPFPTHAEENGKLSLETGMHYNSGKYGGTQATDILYIPVTAKYQMESWTLKLTVPYLQITGPSNVIRGVGQTTAAASTTRTTRSGLGDVIMSASRSVYRDPASGFFANLTGKVKLGTASSAKGLGTGENDYSLQADLYQVSGNTTAFGSAGYKVRGQPAGYTLNDTFFGYVGASYRFDQDTSGGAMLNLDQKVTTNGSAHAEALFFVSQKLQKGWKAQGYVLRGFTKSVPDWGAGISVAYQL